jgi:hypothetical protein
MTSDLALLCSVAWPATYLSPGSFLAASTAVRTVDEIAATSIKTVRIPLIFWVHIFGNGRLKKKPYLP